MNDWSTSSFRRLLPDSEDIPSIFWARNGNLNQLYALGAEGVLQRKCCICVTGSRSASAEACARIQELSCWLCDAAETLIVSGGALGIDSAAHEGALRSTSGATCVVLPVELSTVLDSTRYAQLFQRTGVENRLLFLSQFTSADRDFRFMPLRRNETLAALCNVGLVGSCGIKSGTLSTVRHFLRFEMPFYYLKPLAHDAEDWQAAARYFQSVGGRPLYWESEDQGRELAKAICSVAAEEKPRQHQRVLSQMDLFGG